MGNLFRTGGGNNKINPTVNASAVACELQNDGRNTTVTITATKDAKKALLVASASFGCAGTTYLAASVTSNKTLTALPGVDITTKKAQLNGIAAAINSACLIYIVNDVKKGDYFTLKQTLYEGAYYKSLTLISLD